MFHVSLGQVVVKSQVEIQDSFYRQRLIGNIPDLIPEDSRKI